MYSKDSSIASRDQNNSFGIASQARSKGTFSTESIKRINDESSIAASSDNKA